MTSNTDKGNTMTTNEIVSYLLEEYGSRTLAAVAAVNGGHYEAARILDPEECEKYDLER